MKSYRTNSWNCKQSQICQSRVPEKHIVKLMGVHLVIDLRLNYPYIQKVYDCFHTKWKEEKDDIAKGEY